MSYLEHLLSERNIPSLTDGIRDKEGFAKRREVIKQILQDEMFGKIPKKPEHMNVSIIDELPFAAGKATVKKLIFTFENGDDKFSFPVLSIIPKTEKKVPAFINISFYSEDQNKYTPSEEIIDNGFALFSFGYKDVTTDDDDFKSGIAPNLLKSRRRSDAPGKIAMWAWAAMRVMDYVETLEVIDLANVAVIGHSRLGKTALLTGGFDERFKYVISNESGCAGAAIERGKIGETYKLITDRFPFWFCPSFVDRAQSGDSFLFDQHFLTALTAPRILIIGSAELDLWADPTSELLGALATNEAYSIYGMSGLVHYDKMPPFGEALDEGNACYYVREGVHYLSRHDWNTYCNIIKKKL